MNRFEDISVTSIDSQLEFETNERRRGVLMEELLYIYVMYKNYENSFDCRQEFKLVSCQGAWRSQVSLLFTYCLLSYKDEKSASLFDIFSLWHCERKREIMSDYMDGPLIPQHIQAYACFWDRGILASNDQHETIFPYDYGIFLIDEIRKSEILYPYVAMIDEANEKLKSMKVSWFYKDFKLPQDLFKEHLFKVNRNYLEYTQKYRFA